MITGNDFLQLSNRWSMLPSTSGGGEAVWRTSICRAYYGAFHLGKGALSAIGIGTPVNNVHLFICEALQETGNPDLVKAGRMLIELRDCRVGADYKLTVTGHGEQKLAQQCYYDAITIQSLLKSGIAGNHTDMRAKVEKWAREVRKTPGF